MRGKPERSLESQPESNRLDSWKEIAAYLRRGARTVQRWEREAALPVHRLHHHKLGSVYAYKAELDAWFVARGPEPAAEAPPAVDSAASLAVLPFRDMSQDGNQAYFCDGIAEEILNALSRIEGVRTASRMSSFRFRDPGADIREIGRQLGVKAVVEGSVRKSDDRLRIAVQIIDTETGFQLWAHRYDRTGTDILGVQDQIAESVARGLEAVLPLGDRLATAHHSPAAGGAIDCYRRGRKYYEEFSPQGMEFAIEMFVRAIALDPHYAPAYAGLADCWSYSYLYAGRSEAVLEQADWASLKAQEMGPESGQSWTSRGMWLSASGRLDDADRAFETAIRLDPGLFEAYYSCARHRFASGRFDDAAEAYRNALRTRPGDYPSHLLLAEIEDSQGRHDSAKAERTRGVEIAEERLKWNPGDARALYLMANGLARLGDHTRSRKLVERAFAIRPGDPMLLYNLGCVYSLLGLEGPALDCLERSVSAGFMQKEWFDRDQDLDCLRTLPRFRHLLGGMSCPGPRDS